MPYWDDYNFEGDDETIVASGNWFDGMADNGDGSYTDGTGTIWENGLVAGYALGDGLWQDPDGIVYDENNIAIGQLTEEGEFLAYREPGDPNSGTDVFQPIDLGNQYAADAQGGGFLNWLSNLFSGGSGGGGNAGGGNFGGGGGSMGSGSSQQQQRAQQAQQNLQSAQQAGAPAATIAALQRELAAALADMRGTDTSKTFLIAAAVGLGVYAWTRRRD